jgi:hypothetical protein
MEKAPAVAAGAFFVFGVRVAADSVDEIDDQA